jgi:ABC-2 type transport system ATP-binding protein
MDGSAIAARGLGKTYRHRGGATRALADVNLTIPRGRIYGLIGRNGAGKTTFLRICGTQLLPDEGEVRVLGIDVRHGEREIRPRIAVIPQESRPLYFLTVDELVYYYLKLRGMDAREARQRTDRVLDELSLEDRRDTLVSRLSGGTRRRAMVAMILASDAEVLFLDEPTTGLDPLARREVWTAVRRASHENRTVLLTTHYLDEAEALSSRLALLENGRVMLEGTPADIRARVRLPVRVSVDGTLSREELSRYGEVSPLASGGHIVFAQECDARELAQRALAIGARVSMAPVTLEDVFLQVVGRPLEEGEESGAEAEAAA